MMRSRTILTLFLSGLMLLILTGCEGKNNHLPAATPSSTGYDYSAVGINL